MYRELIFIGFFFLLGCSNNEKQKYEWAGTNWFQLKNVKILLRLPTEFKTSSRFRIKEDIPIAKKFSNQLPTLQNYLEYLESLDSEIDVLVDTTKEYRMVVICNSPKVNIDVTSANIIRQQMEVSFGNKEKINPLLTFSKIKGKWKENTTHKLAQYSTEILDLAVNSKLYNTIYLLSGPSFTLQIYEISNEPENIEKYLWTSKVL